MKVTAWIESAATGKPASAEREIYGHDTTEIRRQIDRWVEEWRLVHESRKDDLPRWKFD